MLKAVLGVAAPLLFDGAVQDSIGDPNKSCAGISEAEFVREVAHIQTEPCVFVLAEGADFARLTGASAGETEPSLNITYCAGRSITARVIPGATDRRSYLSHRSAACGATTEAVMASPDGSARRALRMSFQSDRLLCNGDRPVVFTIAHYCPASGSARTAVVKLEAEPIAARRADTRAWSSSPADANGVRRPVRERVVATRYRCQFHMVVATPALCRSPKHADPAIQRLEEVVRVLYLDRSGYITRNHSVPEIPQLATTYGELTTLGAISMFDHVSRLSPSKRITASSEFFDLGSGTGKVVFAAALLTAACATGIELVLDRHRLAVEAHREGRQLGLLNNTSKRIRFVAGDAIDRTALANATHVYVANLCFSPDMNTRLALVIGQLKHIQVVMTLAELALDLEEGGWPTAAGAGLALGQVATAQMTWNDAPAKLYFYCRSGSC